MWKNKRKIPQYTRFSLILFRRKTTIETEWQEKKHKIKLRKKCPRSILSESNKKKSRNLWNALNFGLPFSSCFTIYQDILFSLPELSQLRRIHFCTFLMVFMFRIDTLGATHLLSCGCDPDITDIVGCFCNSLEQIQPDYARNGIHQT